VGRSFSIYAHIPFCRSRCAYCDFNTYAVQEVPERAYVAALVKELEGYGALESWQGARVRSIYFGGGTPSLLGPEFIGRVIETIGRLWAPTQPGDPKEQRVGSNDAGDVPIEITLEANPGTVDPAKLRSFRALGVNRLSLGVQSFQPRQLKLLGRSHSAGQACAVIEQGRAAGFEDLSIDLMFAVPGQTIGDWESDLRTAIRLEPDHVSTYNLTFEAGTPLHDLRERGRLDPVSEESEAVMFTRAADLLGPAGYHRYEVSNHARTGHESSHNINYWRGGEYLGIGAGAHSFVRQPVPGRRWDNEKDPDGYLRRIDEEGQARVFEERLSRRQAKGEFVFLGLRLSNGIDGQDFADRFGVDFTAAFPHVRRLVEDDLLIHEGSRWRLTPRGLIIADSVFVTFL